MHWQCEVHPCQPLQLLCLSSKCENNQALCFLCKQEMHLDHEPVLPLRLYLDAFLSVKTPPENWASQTAQIDQQLVRIKQGLVKLKNKFVDFAIVEEAFRLFWRKTTQQILRFNKSVENLSSIVTSGDQQTVRELNSWIKKYSSLYYFQENEENRSLYSLLLKEKYVALKDIAENIDELRGKTTFDDFQVLGLFQVKETQGMKPRLYFSEDLKGECMTIQNPTKASMSKTGNQRMILLEPALTNNRSIKKWRVKMSKLASWIGVGIAHLDSIKTANFEFVYTNPNHGNYLISSNGYSWNGYKMEYNSKFQPFTFATGDIVEISYDPPGCKITFSKEGSEKSFTYEVDPGQKPLHAAINMTGIGDTVEILQ